MRATRGTSPANLHAGNISGSRKGPTMAKAGPGNAPEAEAA